MVKADQRRLLLPLAVLLIGCALSLLAWRTAHTALDENFRRSLQGSAVLHAGLLVADLERIESSLGRMARRWSTPDGTSPDIWRNNAQTRLTAFLGLTSIERLDADMNVRWRTSGAGEDFARNDPVALSAAERERLLAARGPGELSVSDIDVSPDQSPSVSLYTPLYIDQRFDGFVAFHLDLGTIFTALVQRTGTANHIEFHRNDARIFALGSGAAPGGADWSGRAPATVGPLTVEVSALPTAAFLDANGQGVPNILLAFGIVVTLLLTLMTFLGVKLAQRASALLESKRVYEEVCDNSDVGIGDIDMSELYVWIQSLKSQGVKDLRVYLDENPAQLEAMCHRVRINTMNRAGIRLYDAQSVSDFTQAGYYLQRGRPDQVRAFALGMWQNAQGIRREVNYKSFTGRDIILIYSLRLPRTLEESRRVPFMVLDMTGVRSAESAHQASIAKSQFLASMSHEIRTPLNGVVGNLELLAQTGLTGDQEELLFDAEKAAKSLLALVGNILDFSKIEAGKLTIESVELNPAMILQDAVDIVQSRARQKGTFITSFISPDVPEIVKGDPTRIRQILLNLLGNSVKFTAQGGVHINLRTAGWDDRLCQLLFTVHDSGRGFEQSRTHELFQPFAQDNKRIADDMGGTGLGLSICKSLVDTFGGEINCQAEPGKGASFWFTIPVQVIEPAPAYTAPDLSGRRALFINADDEALPRGLVDYLVARGASILTARDESAALAMCRKATSTGAPIELAIYMTTRTQWPTTTLADALRECNTVPMVYAGEASHSLWRKALRSGASHLIADDGDAAFFDRNIHLVFGGMSPGLERAVARENGHSVDTQFLTGKHALVLEDRLVNQTIIQRQLKKLDMTCTIAGDGVVGLEKLAAGSYDLILCDCSMPEMNGYDFTRIVRKRESERSDGSRIPIIAMTANAFREDREKCFDAGMDDFISKPVTMHRLASVLAVWLDKKHARRTVANSNSPAGPPQGGENAAALDIEILQYLLGSTDRELISDIIGEFMTAAQESWREVQASMQSRDPMEVSKAAHGAKGEARNVGARMLGNLYEELEKAARQKDLDNVDVILTAIPGELERVQTFVNEYARRSA